MPARRAAGAWAEGVVGGEDAGARLESAAEGAGAARVRFRTPRGLSWDKARAKLYKGVGVAEKNRAREPRGFARPFGVKAASESKP